VPEGSSDIVHIKSVAMILRFLSPVVFANTCCFSCEPCTRTCESSLRGRARIVCRIWSNLSYFEHKTIQIRAALSLIYDQSFTRTITSSILDEILYLPRPSIYFPRVSDPRLLLKQLCFVCVFVPRDFNEVSRVLTNQREERQTRCY
jgi:hypothetical protein